MEDALALAALLKQARRAVVFTGAGMSTESGIPDFRSGDGIWTKMMPVQFRDYIADPQARRISWQRRFEMEETWNAVQPNAGITPLPNSCGAAWWPMSSPRISTICTRPPACPKTG